jgi:hypothetical protein
LTSASIRHAPNSLSLSLTMHLREQVNLPARFQGDELLDHQPLRRNNSDPKMDEYKPPAEEPDSESEVKKSQPRKRQQLASTKKKVQLKDVANTVKKNNKQRKKTSVIDGAPSNKSKDVIPTSTPKQFPSHYQRCEHYNPEVRKIGGIDFDKDGNPQHGTGEILGKRDQAAKAKNNLHFVKFDAQRKPDERLSEGLLRRQRIYEKEYSEWLGSLSRFNLQMPGDLLAQIYSSPVDYFAFQDEMATSSEDESVDEPLDHEEVRVSPSFRLHQ